MMLSKSIKKFKESIVSIIIFSLLFNPIAFATHTFIELDFKDSPTSHRLHVIMPLSNVMDISHLELDLNEQSVTVHKENKTVDTDLNADILSVTPHDSVLNLLQENIHNLPWHLGQQGLECFLS